jgi:predicted nucleic-acid-binding protein
VRAIDTNVLVRALLRDDEEQAAVAERAIDAGAWCSHLVLMETAWVLRKLAGWSREDVAAGLDLCMSMPGLTIDERTSVRVAIDKYPAYPAITFSDAMILAHAAGRGHGPLLTFDRDLANLRGAEGLSATRRRRK